mmetsp:Transcript_2486/g.6283  ORF Transcript_2486/g.6283 Transcript_2486/m.6283 type:complete len:82 (+) Transcript_2486:744-989(+)
MTTIYPFNPTHVPWLWFRPCRRPSLLTPHPKSICPSVRPSVPLLKLIYNTPVVFTAPYSDKTSFEQIYFFPKGYNPMSAEA